MMAFASGGGQGWGLVQRPPGLLHAGGAYGLHFSDDRRGTGLWATLLTVIGYVVFFAAGCMISVHAPDRFGLLLGFGLTFLVTLQALLNIGVTTATLPNKGLPLPFVSYGGSNLMFWMVAVGLLLNLHCHAVFPEDERPSGLPGGVSPPGCRGPPGRLRPGRFDAVEPGGPAFGVERDAAQRDCLPAVAEIADLLDERSRQWLPPDRVLAGFDGEETGVGEAERAVERELEAACSVGLEAQAAAGFVEVVDDCGEAGGDGASPVAGA